MRNITALLARLVLGGYLSVHGAQKLFGSFGGSGLDVAGAHFEKLGLRPGKAMATLAGASELGGGLLTASGVAYPLGPLAVAGSMAVATAVHRRQGPMALKGGFELPLTNLALAALAGAGGPGRPRLGPRLPKRLARLSFLGGSVLTGLALAQVLRSKPPAHTPAGTSDSQTSHEVSSTAPSVAPAGPSVAPPGPSVAPPGPSVAPAAPSVAPAVPSDSTPAVPSVSTPVGPDDESIGAPAAAK
jgi:putative oxidoreductase